METTTKHDFKTIYRMDEVDPDNYEPFSGRITLRRLAPRQYWPKDSVKQEHHKHVTIGENSESQMDL